MRKDKYGLPWDEDLDDAQIERAMLQQGGRWAYGHGFVGHGLLFHFKEYWRHLWPDDSQNRWTDLMLREILKNQFTSLVGPGSSWKSTTLSRLVLMDWSLFPDCTTVIMSSTTMDGLRARIYGDTTTAWNRAHELHEWFPGHPIDYKCVIANDNVEEDKARDIRNGIVGVPCLSSSGKFMGMGRYAGRKNRRVWCVAEEFQFMERSILDSQDNLVSNGPNLVPGLIRDKADLEYGKAVRGYKCVFSGNPNPSRPDNPLHLVSEPEGGFNSIAEDGKSKAWDCKKLPDHPVKCRCVNLDALDSPNNDFPGEKPRWPSLAGPHKLKLYTEGSESYWSQGRGVFKFGLAQFKIITKEICEQFHCFNNLLWSGLDQTKIGMCDASYGGGDRCALGWLEFGKCVDGVTRILLHPYWIIPIRVDPKCPAEDQIAVFTKDKMESAGVLPQNFFFDGRGSLGVSFSRIWSTQVNSIEFGGRPTERVVEGEWTRDKDGQRREKLAFEHYSKFVSELWWSWRYAIEADQIRGLTLELVLDASPREWKKVAGDKKEIETKADMKKRTGVSPDLADMLVAGLEGARRRGFVIKKIKPENEPEDESDKWLVDLEEKNYRLVTSKQLSYK